MRRYGKLLLSLSVSLIVTSAYADIPDGKNAFQANASITRGGLALGVDFENGYSHTYGLGGYFRLMPSSQSNGADGVTTIGAFIRPHFSRQQWDFYLSPGFGLVFLSPANSQYSNQIFLGPSLGLGLLYELSPKFAVGIEQNTYAAWLGGIAPYRGIIAGDLAVKVRFIY